MFNVMLKRVTVIYQAGECDKCGALSHYGELVPVKEANGWAYICPKCYTEATRPKKYLVTCLRDPERRKELLERYMEE
jgi:hypothetical protein